MTALGTRSLTLDIGGTSVTAQVGKLELRPTKADLDYLTFGDAQGDPRLWIMYIEAVQDMATGTLWDKIWSGAGTSVAYIARPYGNAAPTALQPHFTGNATIALPEDVFIGGEADTSKTARFTFEVEWECAAQPVKVTA